MPGALQQIGCRRDSRERMEVVDEVRLVVVPAIERQIDPVDLIGAWAIRTTRWKRLTRPKTFGGEANLFPEQLNETALTESCLVHNFGDRQTSTAQLLNAETNRGCRSSILTNCSSKSNSPGRGSWALDTASARASQMLLPPKRIERDGLVKHALAGARKNGKSHRAESVRPSCPPSGRACR